MIIVSGKTFEHRETIKAMGGRFDGTTKSWTIRNALPATLERLRALPGVVVTGDVDASQEPAAPIEPPHPAKPAPVPVMRNKTNCFGDDMTYFNAFADKDPISFAGFSSLGTMIEFVEAIPAHIACDHRRNEAWNVDYEYGKFAASYSMRDALNTAKNGWTKGVTMAKQVIEMLETKNATQRTAVYAVAGGRVNVGRMLSGLPNHMIRRPKMPAQKIITLFVDTGMSSAIDPDDAIKRAACVAAIADLLEENGYSCEIVGAACTHDRQINGKPCSQLAVKLKNAGEKLNLNDLVFAFGHPAFHRRMTFAVRAFDQALSATWKSMGYTKRVFTETASNEFYIRYLSMHVDFNGDIAKILKYIIPENLPITIKAE